MSSEDYENRTDSVLAWKKAQRLGRFDPDAPSIEEQKKNAILREIQERGMSKFKLDHEGLQVLPFLIYAQARSHTITLMVSVRHQARITMSSAARV